VAFEHWYCEKCRKESTVQYKKNAGVYDVRNMIEYQHTRKSSKCALNNGIRFVRVGFPDQPGEKQ
jgi:hypothetical protein